MADDDIEMHQEIVELLVELKGFSEPISWPSENSGLFQKGAVI